MAFERKAALELIRFDTMLRIYLVLIIFVFCWLLTVAQQTDLSLRSNVLEQIVLAQQAYSPIQYKAQMRFKGFEADTFEIRHCSLSYRANKENKLYGYDWKHEEDDARGFSLAIMAMPEGLYTAYKDDSTKIIVHRALQQQIAVGSYFETMRNYFFIDQNIEPFIAVPVGEIGLVDSSNVYVLTVNTSDDTKRLLVISKDTYLPIQSRTVSTYMEFDLAQVLEINFNYDDDATTLSDTVFSVDHYLKAGYEYRFVEEQPEEESAKLVITPEMTAQLLYYPLIDGYDDTTYLHALDAGYILLDFWFASCLPCLQAMPELNQLSEKYAAAGLRVFGVNCFDLSNRANLTSRFKAKQIGFPLLFGDRALVDQLGITAYPSYLLITPDRDIEYLEVGLEVVKGVLAQLLDH